jgi:magnesium-transporting ATPase (P-type)
MQFNPLTLRHACFIFTSHSSVFRNSIPSSQKHTNIFCIQNPGSFKINRYVTGYEFHNCLPQCVGHSLKNKIQLRITHWRFTFCVSVIIIIIIYYYSFRIVFKVHINKIFFLCSAFYALTFIFFWITLKLPVYIIDS